MSLTPNTYLKPSKIRSKKITASARGEACTLRVDGVCNHDPKTTVFAHLPGYKGTGTKNHDLFGVYACDACHGWLDGRNRGRHYGPFSIQGLTDQIRAQQETQLKLVQKKLIEVK